MRAATMADRKGLLLLKDIGNELDRDIYPVVHENGRVMPGAGRSPNSPGKEMLYAFQPEAGSRGPAARQGQGAPARGSATAGAEALVLGQPGLSDDAHRDLVGAIAAYPRTRVRFVPPVAWLVTPIRPVDNLPDAALLVTRYLLDQRARRGVRPNVSWAWWDVGVWIGPRHTNFPDGSICAYEPTQGTWTTGNSLLLWFDLHAVWIARHVHLRYFDRWPGDQVLHTAFERVREHRPGELCGCGSMQPYEECHQAADLARTPYDRAREFHKHYPDPYRRPDPEAVATLLAVSG